MGMKRLLTFGLVFTFGYTSYFFLVAHLSNQHYRRDPSSDYEYADTYVNPNPNNFALLTSAEQCQPVHLGMIAQDAGAVRESVKCLKTILSFRTRPLALHFIVTEHTRYILKTLFDTWQLPLVHVLYHIHHINTSETLVKRTPSVLAEQQLQTFLNLTTILPSSVTKLIAVDKQMRFFQDIGLLWSEFEKMPQDKPIAMPEGRDKENQRVPMFGLVLLNLERLKTQASVENVSPVTGHLIDGCWNVDMSRKRDRRQCPGEPRAVYNPQQREGFAFVHSLREKLNQITITNGEIFRNTFIPCRSPQDTVTDIPPRLLGSKCAEFKYAVHLKRRTHLYYRGTPPTDDDPYEVTMMTMFTIDRFESVVRMYSSWHGPSTAVVYLTDEELVTFEQKINQSPVLKHRKNIVFHLVFKRHRLNPINYLRNVAVKNTHTAYSVFLDIDLIPNAYIHDYLKSYLRNNTTYRECFVIAAFHTKTKLKQHPQNRKDLLALLRRNIVTPYNYAISHSHGHDGTDFARWRQSPRPYRVKKPGWPFEPYVVMKTVAMPLYSENVLDRMHDKSLFTAGLVRRGYMFKVLPEVFIIHYPHVKSDGSHRWATEQLFRTCSKRMVAHERFKKRKQ